MKSEKTFPNVRKMLYTINNKLNNIGTNDYEQTCTYAMSYINYSENGANWELYVHKPDNEYYLFIYHDSFRHVVEVDYVIDNDTDEVNVIESSLDLN